MLIIGVSTPVFTVNTLGFISKETPSSFIYAFLTVPLPLNSVFLASTVKVLTIELEAIFTFIPSALISNLSHLTSLSVISIPPIVFFFTVIPSKPSPVISTSSTFILDLATSSSTDDVPDTTIRTGPSSFCT